MFNTIHNRFNWRSGRARLIAAAAICVAGLVIGTGAGTLLAQLKGPNPATSTEAGSCVGQVGGCVIWCKIWGQGSEDVTAVSYQGCKTGPAGEQCQPDGTEVVCGEENLWGGNLTCSGPPMLSTPYQQPLGVTGPGC